MMMVRQLLGSLIMGALAATAGCADVQEPESQAHDTETAGQEDSADAGVEREVELELEEKAAALGFDTSEIAFVGPYIRVEGDIILDRQLLLEGAYKPLVQPPEPGVAIQKGYRTPSQISSTNAKNVTLKWLTATNPNATIRNAFVSAADDVNSTWSSVFVRQNNTGPAITVAMVAASTWPATTPCDAADASCAMFPANGKPGTAIWIKDTAPGGVNCPTWTSSALANRTRHELLHALGIHHPVQGTWIPNTKSCTNTVASKCPQSPGYPTVMVKAASCSTSVTTLQPDDRDSLGVLYP